MHCDPWMFSQQYKVALLCSLKFPVMLHSRVVLCHTPPGFTLLINRTLMNEVCLEVIPFVSPNRVCCLFVLLLLLIFVYPNRLCCLLTLLLLTFVYPNRVCCLHIVLILVLDLFWVSRCFSPSVLSLTNTKGSRGSRSKCSLISTGLGAGLGTLFTLKYMYVGVRTTSKTATLVRLELKW